MAQEKVIAIDFETFYTKSYSVQTMLPEDYCWDERFDAYLMSAFDGTEPWAGHPSEFDWSSLKDAVVLAHNKRFDYCVWLELWRRGIVPEPAFREFHCTANLAAYSCNRRPLADAVGHYFGVSLSKAARTDMKDKHWKDLTPEQQAVMIEYAKKDVIWCHKLWEHLSPKWPDLERDAANMTIEQGMHGIKIDEQLLDHYLFVTRRAVEATIAAIPWSGKRAPSSPQALAEECRKVGIPCPPIKVEDEEGHAEWEAAYGDRFPWVRGVSSFRSLAKQVSTFELVKERIRPDGTMPFALKYFGAHTGRWSGDGKMNLQNPRKDAILIRKGDHIMESDEAKCRAAAKEYKKTGKYPDWVEDAVNFRHLLIPREGKKMITADLSQIEPRVLAWCAGDHEFLDIVRTGISPYEAFARKNGWKGGDLREEDPALYQLAKIQVLGLGYGCGWRKFITIAAGYDIDLTEGDPEFETVVDPLTNESKTIDGFGANSRRIVEAFRKASPKIVALWRRLDAGFKASVGGDFTITLPSGRALTYEKVKRECRVVPNPSPDKPTDTAAKWVFTAQVGYKRESRYGGLLTENLVQAAACDVFKENLTLMWKYGLRSLFSCHDEGIFEVEPDVTPADVSKEFCRTPEWIEGLPLSSEAKEVKHYTK